MTMTFNTVPLTKLMVGQGFFNGFTNPFAISIYSGTKPTAAQILASWASYNTSNPNFLAHYQGAAWTHPGNGQSIQLSTVPPAVLALNTGTAAWCILWATNVSSTNVASSTLAQDKIVVADVSTFTGSGIIRFTDLSFVANASKSILTGSLSVI